MRPLALNLTSVHLQTDGHFAANARGLGTRQLERVGPHTTVGLLVDGSEYRVVASSGIGAGDSAQCYLTNSSTSGVVAMDYASTENRPGNTSLHPVIVL